MKRFFLAGLLALSSVLPAAADLKIALIDTGKAFDAFHRTQELAAKVAAKKASFEKDIRDLQLDYDSAREQAQELEAAVKSPTTPMDVRNGKDAALAQKVQDLQMMEREIEQMRRSRSGELKDELVRSHQKIADEMMKIIVAYVSNRGYDLVLDRSTSPTALSLFPYSSVRIVDLTAEIIKQLNAASPGRAENPQATPAPAH